MVDVIVINWNSGEQLRRCIESLLEHGRRQVGRIVVIDNGSSDGSERSIEGMEAVTLVRAGSNLGFACACNLGVASARADYVLLLNPDTRIYADSLSVPLAFMRSPAAAQVGIVGIGNVADDGSVQRTCSRFPTPASFIVHSFGLNALWPKRFPDHLMREWPHDEDRQVDHVIGSFFLVRRKLWSELGGMDERFFVYLEDLDFSLRAHRRGWTTWFLAGARIYHKGGGTSEQIKTRRLFYSLRSRLLYAGKHFGRPGFAAVLASTVLVEPVTRVGAATARRQWTTIGETVRAYAALYRELPAILRRARSAA